MKEKNTIWDMNTNKEIDTPESINEFFEEIELLFKKHNISISHEDYHGGFILESYSEKNIEWLKEASTRIKVKKVSDIQIDGTFLDVDGNTITIAKGVVIAKTAP